MTKRYISRDGELYHAQHKYKSRKWKNGKWVYEYDDSQSKSNNAQAKVNKLVSRTTNAFNSFKMKTQNAVNSIKKQVPKEVERKAKTALIKDAVKTAINESDRDKESKKKLQKTASNVIDKVETASNKVRKAVNNAGKRISDTVVDIQTGRAADKAEKKIEKAKKKVSKFIEDVDSGKVAERVKKKAESVKKDVSKAVDDIKDTVKDKAQNAGTKVKTAVNSAKDQALDKLGYDEKQRLDAAEEIASSKKGKLGEKRARKIADRLAAEYANTPLGKLESLVKKGKRRR